MFVLSTSGAFCNFSQHILTNILCSVQFACMQSQQGIAKKFQNIQDSMHETQFFENNLKGQ